MLVADRGLRQYGRVWQIKNSLCYAMLPRLSAQYLEEPSPGRVGLRRLEKSPQPYQKEDASKKREGVPPQSDAHHAKKCVIHKASGVEHRWRT